MDPSPSPPVHLVRSRERLPEVEALVAAAGGRVGLRGVVDALERTGRTGRRVRRWGASYAFTWDRHDDRDPRWWPQGVTSSADAGGVVAPGERYAGRRVLLTSAYARKVGGRSQGARISVVDLTDRRHPRYAHVLLVEPRLEDGRLQVRPVHAHAGGIVWRGPHLHVAGTAKGLLTFRLDDVVAAGSTADELGARAGGMAAHGHPYLLPTRFLHTAHTAEGAEPFRYSFLSLVGGGRPGLLAGEYDRAGPTARVLRYDLDDTGLPVADATGACRPAAFEEVGVARMQGAVEVEGRLHVTTSNGRYGRGSLWVGSPGALVRHRWALPAGPEDLCHWPSEDRLWTVTEYPRRRAVLALDRSRFA